MSATTEILVTVLVAMAVGTIGLSFIAKAIFDVATALATLNALLVEIGKNQIKVGASIARIAAHVRTEATRAPAPTPPPEAFDEEAFQENMAAMEKQILNAATGHNPGEVML